MPGKSDYSETAVLNGFLRNTGIFAQSGSVYVGLKTADPTDDNSGGTEPTIATNAYARVAVARGTGAWDAPANSSGAMRTANTAAITFPTSSGAWASSAALTHFIIMDASTAGNLLYSGALSVSRTVDATGITISFAIGALTIDES
jgi:hypothetical protein